MNNATWYYESGSASTEITASVSQSGYNCSIGNGVLLHQSNGSYDFTLTVTWNGESITSGILSQSNNNGDHEFRFKLNFGYSNDYVDRSRYLTVTGNNPFHAIYCTMSHFNQFQDLLLL